MTDRTDDILLNSLERLISMTDDNLKKLRTQKFDDGDSVQNIPLDPAIFNFTLDEEESALMGQLQEKLEEEIGMVLSNQTARGKKYLVGFLEKNEFNQRKKKFGKSLNEGTVKGLLQGLYQIRDSIGAFRAAWEGNQREVADYISKYPKVKDESGPWGTTLLFTAARNNYMELVSFLIDEAKCFVNAQNQQHIARVLGDQREGEIIDRNPSAGSTALHAACFYNHLNIVKYLFEKGADYYLKNHNDETPIDNGRGHPEIIEFFKENLVVGYALMDSSVPHSLITENPNAIRKDCIWEYKPLSDKKWYSFSPSEADQFQKSLIVEDGHKFEPTVRLIVTNGVFLVDMFTLLRSGRDQTYGDRCAWVRCRGSAMLNFGCYALWQVLFESFPDAANSDLRSMETIPSLLRDDFRVNLRTWYFCDAKTNEKLEKAMMARRKIFQTDMDALRIDSLTFDMAKFEFKNRSGNIHGYIRWLPKMISIDSAANKGRAVSISDSRAISSLNPVPLTVERLKLLQTSDGDDASDEDIGDESDDDSELSHFNQVSKSDTEDSPEEKQTELTLGDYMPTNSITSEKKLMDELQSRSSESFVTASLPEELSSASREADLDAATISYNISQLKEAELKASTAALEEKFKQKLDEQSAEYEEKMTKVEEELKKKIQNLESLSKADKNNQKYIASLNEDLQNLQKEKQAQEEDRRKFQSLVKRIISRDQKNIPTFMVEKFLLPNHHSIIGLLKEKTPNLDERLADRIPQIRFNLIDDKYHLNFTGFYEQYEQFKQILTKIWTFLKIVTSEKQCSVDGFRRATVNIMRYILPKVSSKSKLWSTFKSIYKRLLEEKKTEYFKLSSNYWEIVTRKMRTEVLITNETIIESMVRQEKDEFIAKNPIEVHLEQVRINAFEEFIQKTILIQQLPKNSKITPKSRNVLSQFIQILRQKFLNHIDYRGSKLENFRLIPKIIQQAFLFYRAFLIQLPLYESALELLNEIENNTVTTISTSTGSGKSTLLPILLIANGYNKVIVTQPRRLPCQLISKRVNETTTSEQDFGDPLAGWAVSGSELNPNAKVLYLTDGLLKERLLVDSNLIPNKTTGGGSIVIFIDEVHERSVNIDLCLALLARKLALVPELRSKLKVIISSATLNKSVPNMFQRIPQLKLGKFDAPTIGKLYEVRESQRPGENAVDVVRELCKKRQRHEQILCFLSSAGDINDACKLMNEMSQETITAYPLVQSQKPEVQKDVIENGSVFFSTTIAETSLTFPSLKYVVDTGKINVPVYNPAKKRTELKEIQASASTIKQRLGRLGRTQPGEYYSLYDFNVAERDYPVPQICQSELSNIEFSLRKSKIRQGLSYLSQFLPDPPPKENIDLAVKEIQDLGIIESSDNNRLSKLGENIARLPDFGSLQMAKAVYAGLDRYDCGHDMICLASILGVINTTSIFKSVPEALKDNYGDFMTLLKIMRKIVRAEKSVEASQFSLPRVCDVNGLTKVHHIIRQALRRYRTLEKLFNHSEFPNALTFNGEEPNWERIAKSLVFGYSDQIFVSMKSLQGRTHLFVNYYHGEEQAKLDFASTLSRKVSEAPVELVFARDTRYASFVRSGAIVSFLGEIKPEWIENPIQRIINVTDEDVQHLKGSGRLDDIQKRFTGSTTIQLINKQLQLNGQFCNVLKAELEIRQKLVETRKFTLGTTSTSIYETNKNFSNNLSEIVKLARIFNPMKWRWELDGQVEINIDTNFSTKACEISLKGPVSHNSQVKKEFDAFISWLKTCSVFRHPNAGIRPRPLVRNGKENYREIEERIARIADPARNAVDIHNACRGQKATRETRMEVVAWLAVCRYDCVLEGGFIRDWVIRKDVQGHPPPDSPSSDWIETMTPVPAIKKTIVPSDLDCQLPTSKLFDVDKFQDDLFKYGITCSVNRQAWRYVLLFDEKASTGAFTMDLIEPHIALTHDRIDFDVNNLSIEKDYTHDLGMRIDIQRKPYSISLEDIVKNAQNKKFRLLRHDDKLITDRVNKMVNVRGWQRLLPDMNVLPTPHEKVHSYLVPLPPTSTLYKIIVDKMKVIDKIKIHSIEEISNPDLEEAYNAFKRIVAKQCANGNPNERELFHGTKPDAVASIIEDGYDDRYFSAGGLYGHGAYFADDPRKSNGYAPPNPADNRRAMFYNKVLLGNPHELLATDNKLISAPKSFHSVIGKHNPQYTEYIIYRYGQALPYLKIMYSDS